MSEDQLNSKKIFLKQKKYCDYDDIEYTGIRNVKDLFHLSIDKGKNLSIKNILI